MNNIDILEEKEKKAIRMCDVLFISLDEIYKDGEQEYRMYYKTIKNLIERLISENKELKGKNNELEKNIFKKLIEVQDENCEDVEYRHRCEDNILCELLKELGYKEIVKQYESTHKWYA